MIEAIRNIMLSVILFFLNVIYIFRSLKIFHIIPLRVLVMLTLINILFSVYSCEVLTIGGVWCHVTRGTTVVLMILLQVNTEYILKIKNITYKANQCPTIFNE